MTGYEAYQIFEHLRDTGTIQAAGEMFGQAIAKGFIAEAAKLDKESAAAPQLANALALIAFGNGTPEKPGMRWSAERMERIAREALAKAGLP